MPNTPLPDSPAVHDDPAHELETAYAQGDFARLRTRARVLRDDKSQPETLRTRASQWLERMSVDVVTYALLAFALLLFCAIVWRYAL
jgi:hypothetical protein